MSRTKKLSVDFLMHGNLEGGQERGNTTLSLPLVIILYSFLIVLIRVHHTTLAHYTQIELQIHFSSFIPIFKALVADTKLQLGHP